MRRRTRKEKKKRFSSIFERTRAHGSDGVKHILLMISFSRGSVAVLVLSVYCISLVFAPGSAHTSRKRLSIEQIISCVIISVVVSRLAAGCWLHSIQLIRFQWFYSIFINISVNWISIDLWTAIRWNARHDSSLSAATARNIAYLFLNIPTQIGSFIWKAATDGHS